MTTATLSPASDVQSLGATLPNDPGRPLGVLVVDDESVVRTLLGLALRRAGFAVWQAAGGPEGLALYAAHRDAIDVVLIDVQMPGMDGPQTLMALRRLDPQVRCCFMSGDPGAHTVEELLALGVAGYLSKPFRLAEVEALVRQTAQKVPC